MDASCPVEVDRADRGISAECGEADQQHVEGQHEAAVEVRPTLVVITSARLGNSAEVRPLPARRGRRQARGAGRVRARHDARGPLTELDVLTDRFGVLQQLGIIGSDDELATVGRDKASA
ncbi:MAG TPA: hypothetical protein VHX38_22115 [Pseudonocardiaceae bacterium]|nr:hypothetical protein [Pseudonocardiaceae bacterium]